MALPEKSEEVLTEEKRSLMERMARLLAQDGLITPQEQLRVVQMLEKRRL